MSYEGSDILFEYFFLTGSPSTWSSRDFDSALGIGSSEQSAHQALLAVESGQSVNQDARFPVAVSLAVGVDTAYEVQAISVSALRLAVEGSGWTDSGLSLTLSAAGISGGRQMLMTVREEDRFTN